MDKFWRRVSVAFCALFLCVSANAQKETNYDVFVPIGKYLAQGNADALSAWFASNLDISILSDGGDVSKSQATQILKSFFSSYTPQSFDISHTAGRSNMKYALGDLKAGGEMLHVSIFVSCKDGTYRIRQFKIDRIH